jgi:hypothetical protein
MPKTKTTKTEPEPFADPAAAWLQSLVGAQAAEAPPADTAPDQEPDIEYLADDLPAIGIPAQEAGPDVPHLEAPEQDTDGHELVWAAQGKMLIKPADPTDPWARAEIVDVELRMLGTDREYVLQVRQPGVAWSGVSTSREPTGCGAALAYRNIKVLGDGLARLNHLPRHRPGELERQARNIEQTLPDVFSKPVADRMRQEIKELRNQAARMRAAGRGQ